MATNSSDLTWVEDPVQNVQNQRIICSGSELVCAVSNFVIANSLAGQPRCVTTERNSMLKPSRRKRFRNLSLEGVKALAKTGL